MAAKLRLLLAGMLMASVASAQLQSVNLGTAPNSGNGSTLRAGGTIINSNFTQLSNMFGATGVLVGNGPIPNALTSATYANITALWSGTCNSTTFLEGDGKCVTPAGGGGGGVSGVSSITAGPGLTISPTTGAAVAQLSPIATGTIMGNNSGASAAAGPLSPGTVQGMLVASNFALITDSPAAGPINDYNASGNLTNTTGWVDVTPASGNSTFNGIAAQADGTALVIANAEAAGGSDNVVLVNQASSDITAANRIRAPGNLYIPPGGRVLCIYRTAIARWSCQ